MANLTDADKVLRNDTGKNIVSALNTIAENLIHPDADNVSYDNTVSGLSATDVQSAVDELSLEKADKSDTYTKSEVDTLIDNLPEPMIFKGTLGVGGTIQTLPTASASNEGWTYKVITDGTYSGQTAKSGDVFVSNGSAWVLIPSGDEDNDTWRAIKVNGTEKLGNAISSGSVDFVDTSDIKVTFDTNGNKVKLTLVKAIPTKTSELQNDSGFTTIDDTQTANNKTWSSEKIVSSVPVVTNYYNKDEIDALLEDKADVDGTYDDMVVGNAKQLKSNVGENDKVPYNFRTSGGSMDIGESETDMLVGGTVAFNQLVQNGNFATTSDWTTYQSPSFSVANNEATIGISSGKTTGIIFSDRNAISNHVYFATLTAKCNTATSVMLRLESAISTNKITSSATYETLNIIARANTSNSLRYNITVTGGEGTSGMVKNAMLIDLTAMFGTTIADYIYTLESNNAGAGVAYFRSLFPKPYYAYNAGELMSVKTSAHKMVGFNQFDESQFTDIKKYIDISKCLVGKNYYICAQNTTDLALFKIAQGSGSTSIWQSVGVSGSLFTMTQEMVNIGRLWVINSSYTAATVEQIQAAKICLNLSWDGERDGEYEPYEEHTYALDSNLELRGIPKLDANNKLYYDGDTYESDGTVTRKYGIVDLGSLDWTFSSTYFWATFTGVKENTTNLVCPMYIVDNSAITLMADRSFKYVSSTTRFIVKNAAYTDADAFKTAMSGVYVVYELETPTTETADPFTNPQIVDDFGTEEYVDSRAVAIPVGHDTFYQANLRAKLEMAPDSPSGNGDYIVRQTDGQNEYVALTKELPTLPTAPDGTYTLKCTVSGGTPTLSWVAD